MAQPDSAHTIQARPGRRSGPSGSRARAHRYKDGLFFEEQRGHKTLGGKPLYCLETAARLWLYAFEVIRTY
jgi:hypothetical protein